MAENDFPGSSYLEARYREIMDEERVAVPIDYDALRREAQSILSTEAYGYVAAGAGMGETKRANETAFDRWQIVPRVLRDIADRDLGIRLFETDLLAPLVLAPIGSQLSYHDAGERASAAAAASLDVPFTLSMHSSTSIEDVADAMGTSPRFFQTHLLSDTDVLASFARRAERAGYGALVVTVDSPIAKWRVRNLTNAYRSSHDTERANFTTDPVVNEKIADRPDREPADFAVKEECLSWESVDRIRGMTDLPIVLKGILRAEDARTALDHGVDGIVVSTHGGRQIDGSIGALAALPDVVAAVDDEIPVLFDSGVRGGADLFKALALGADAVCIGRPYLYGLAIAGERGVYEVALNYLAELESIMGLAGCQDVDSIDRDLLQESR